MQRAQGLDPEETRSSNIKKMAVIRQKLQETSPIICEVRRAVSGNRRTATLHKPFRLMF